MKTRLRLPSILLLPLALAGAAQAASWDRMTPNEAFDKGNYHVALRGFIDRAKLGEEAAQDNVGMMYEQALGTEQDYAAAARRRLVARQRSSTTMP